MTRMRISTLQPPVALSRIHFLDSDGGTSKIGSTAFFRLPVKKAVKKTQEIILGLHKRKTSSTVFVDRPYSSGYFNFLLRLANSD